MGSGIAKSIKSRYPQAYTADKATSKGDRSKLGTYSSVEISGESSFTVVNAYTQYSYSGDKVDVDYEAVRAVFRLIKQDFARKRIGYPLIGAGLAGGDWNILKAIILEELEGEVHTLVEFVPG